VVLAVRRVSGHVFYRSRTVRLVLLAVVLAFLPGCDVDGCETFIHTGPALIVNVRDAQTGAPLGNGVSVTAQNGAYSEQLALVDTRPPQFEGVGGTVERPFGSAGTYVVTVSAAGYEPATASAEVIADDFCLAPPIPSQPVVLDIKLTTATP
jgi:hypothetical protein